MNVLEDCSLQEEYGAILFAMRGRVLLTVDDYLNEYRQRFHTQEAVTRVAAAKHQHVHPFPEGGLAADVSAARRHALEHKSECTFQPVISRKSQEMVLDVRDCVERLAKVDVEVRAASASRRQEEAEHLRQKAEIEEMNAMAALRGDVDTSGKVFRRLAAGGKHQAWLSAEERRKKELLELEREKARKSPRRDDKHAPSRPNGNSIHDDLYQESLLRAGRHKELVEQQEKHQQQLRQQPHRSSDFAHAQEQHHATDDVVTKHVDTPRAGIGRPATSTSPSKREHIHQRLYEEGVERAKSLEAVKEDRRTKELSGMFQPNMELARKESLIKPVSPSLERAASLRAAPRSPTGRLTAAPYESADSAVVPLAQPHALDTLDCDPEMIHVQSGSEMPSDAPHPHQESDASAPPANAAAAKNRSSPDKMRTEEEERLYQERKKATRRERRAQREIELQRARALETAASGELPRVASQLTAGGVSPGKSPANRGMAYHQQRLQQHQKDTAPETIDPFRNSVGGEAAADAYAAPQRGPSQDLEAIMTHSHASHPSNNAEKKRIDFKSLLAAVALSDNEQ